MFDGMLVGDRGYPCQRFLMTPYPDPDARPQQQYNISTAKPGSESRIPFGILKARFNCQRGLRASPQRAYQIVAACAILHKMATIRKEQVPPNHQPPADETDPITMDFPAGRALRDAMTAQYFS